MDNSKQLLGWGGVSQGNAVVPYVPPVHTNTKKLNNPLGKILWFLMGALIGGLICLGVVSYLERAQAMEQEAIDANKLTTEEEVQLDSYLSLYRSRLISLWQHYEPMIRRVHASAEKKLKAKGRKMAFFLETPEMVFAQMIAIQLWEHNSNRVYEQNELDSYFGTAGVFRLPADHIEELRYVQLYHQDFLKAYSSSNRLGVDFEDIDSISSEDMLLVSLLYLSDNNGRPPVASSVINAIEYIFGRLNEGTSERE